MLERKKMAACEAWSGVACRSKNDSAQSGRKKKRLKLSFVGSSLSAQ